MLRPVCLLANKGYARHENMDDLAILISAVKNMIWRPTMLSSRIKLAAFAESHMHAILYVDRDVHTFTCGVWFNLFFSVTWLSILKSFQ